MSLILFGVMIPWHGLTFPVVLQRQWEISREYGMFGTLVGHLIDENGCVAADPATGAEPILALLASAALATGERALVKPCRCGKPDGRCEYGKQRAVMSAGEPQVR